MRRIDNASDTIESIFRVTNFYHHSRIPYMLNSYLEALPKETMLIMLSFFFPPNISNYDVSVLLGRRLTNVDLTLHKEKQETKQGKSPGILPKLKC